MSHFNLGLFPLLDAKKSHVPWLASLKSSVHCCHSDLSTTWNWPFYFSKAMALLWSSTWHTTCHLNHSPGLLPWPYNPACSNLIFKSQYCTYVIGSSNTPMFLQLPTFAHTFLLAPNIYLSNSLPTFKIYIRQCVLHKDILDLLD